MILPLPGTSVQVNEATIVSLFLSDKINEVRPPFPLSRFSIPPFRCELKECSRPRPLRPRIPEFSQQELREQ